MSLDRQLRQFADRATALLDTSSLHQRDIAAGALTRIGRVRLAISRDPQIATLVNDMLVVFRALPEAAQAPEESERHRYSDAQISAACKSSRTLAAAAKKLGCNYRTLTRRRKNA